MKKYISMMLIALCLCFAGCGDDTPEPAVTTAATAGVSETYGENITETVEDAETTAESAAPETTASTDTDAVDTEGADGSVAYTTGDRTSAVTTTGKTDTNAEETPPAFTVPPIFQTLPEGGIELPDDIWD